MYQKVRLSDSYKRQEFSVKMTSDVQFLLIITTCYNMLSQSECVKRSYWALVNTKCEELKIDEQGIGEQYIYNIFLSSILNHFQKSMLHSKTPGLS